MASFVFNSNKLYWTVELDGVDITGLLSPVLSQITVTHKVNKPSSCKLEIRSANYIEDHFIEDRKISVKLGYGKFDQAQIFKGTLDKYPEGTAKELLTYTVSAGGPLSSLALIKQNRTFVKTPIKSAIIFKVVSESGEYVPIIDINDKYPIPVQQVPQQRNQTDLEFLMEMAERWDCVMFTSEPNLLHFVDFDKAHSYGDLITGSFNLRSASLDPEYILSYRSDVFKPNVESVKWNYKTPKGGTMGAPGVSGANEVGAVVNERQYEILFRGRTYRLKDQFLKVAKNNPTMFFTYADMVMRMGGYRALRYFFVERKLNMPTHTNVIPPIGKGYGFDIEITLNEGDPYLRPPRRALLYSGSVNPRADCSDLPAWFFQSGVPATMILNEVEHKFHKGFLNTTVRGNLKGFTVPQRYRVPLLSQAARLVSRPIIKA